MNTKIWDKKIPTLFGVLIVAIGIIVTTILVRIGGFFPINATPSETPRDVRITNITDSSFTVSYSTDNKTSGALNFGESASLGSSLLDDRDQQIGKIENYTIHNFTLHNLKPVTKYFFTIVSGKTTYLNNSVPFEITTGSILNSNPPAQDPLAGKVIMPDGSIPQEAIVYVVAENSQVLSTLIKEDGTYVVPLNSLRVTDLSAYTNLNLDTTIKILATGEGLSSNASLQTLQTRPVPTITLSNDYDFTLNSLPSSSSSATLAGFPPLSERTVGKSPTITTPYSNQNFSVNKPEFKGTALSNQDVQITINSNQEISTTIKADSSGNWSYKPNIDLSSGTHTITIVTRDGSGILKTIKETFTITAQAAQTSPTPTLTISESPTPTLTITPTPEIVENVVSPTPISLVVSQTPITTLPKTGSADIMWTTMISLFLTSFGTIFFLFIKKRFI